MPDLPKATELPIAETRAAREMNPNKGEVHTSGVKLLTSGSVYEDRPPGYDFMHLTDAEIKEMGVNPETHVLAPIRNPEIWERLEHKNRIREFLREAGGRIVPTRDGEPFKNGDLVYAFKSRAEVEANERRAEADARKYQGVIAEGDDLEGLPRYRPGNLDKRARDVEREHQANVMAGIIGPTAGRDFMDVIKENPEKYKRDRARYAGLESRVFEAGADLDERGAERVDKARSGGSGFVRGSIPANVGSKNHAGAKK